MLSSREREVLVEQGAAAAAERARVEQAGEVVLAAGPARRRAQRLQSSSAGGNAVRGVDRVVFDRPAGTQAELDAIAARNNLTVLATSTITLTGRTLHVGRITNGISVPDMIRNLSGEPQIAGAQPNYLYRLAQTGEAPVAADQYAPQKLNLPEAHRLARGNRVLIAVIDFQVDASHPDLAGAITASFAASAEAETPHPHGTGMAGAIAAHRNMLGTAPGVGLLTVRAFSARADSAEGTTFNIIRGLDWAAAQGARVVNMSFAGPPDPRLRDALAKANSRKIVLIAAAGNAGPSSPPLYPAADPNVIAVTATNSDDGLFAGANRGNYIAVAAPGVDVRASAGWRLSIHYWDIRRCGGGERGGGLANRAQSLPHASRGAQDTDGYRQGSWSQRP